MMQKQSLNGNQDNTKRTQLAPIKNMQVESLSQAVDRQMQDFLRNDPGSRVDNIISGHSLIGVVQRFDPHSHAPSSALGLNI